MDMNPRTVGGREMKSGFLCWWRRTQTAGSTQKDLGSLWALKKEHLRQGAEAVNLSSQLVPRSRAFELSRGKAGNLTGARTTR